MTFNRRSFIKTGALTSAYLLLWGCRSTDSATDKFTEQPDPRNEQILVIGAGIAGLTAARELQANGFNVTVLEGRNRIGGRIWTDHSWPDAHLDLGASWIHGIRGNPISELVEQFDIDTLPTDYDSLVLYNIDGRVMDDDEVERVEERFWELSDYIEEESEELDEDISIGTAVDYALPELQLTGQQTRELNYALNTIVEHETATDISELSLFHFGEDDEFGGGDVLFPQGYDQIVNALAEELEIKLDHVVEQIIYNDTGVTVITNQGDFATDRAVVTLPLGVLKQDLVKFSPVLPGRKVEAINNLGMGVLNKVYLHFEERFWPEDTDLLGYVSQEKGEWSEWLNIYKYTELPILLAFNAATYGRAIEPQSDEAIVAAAVAALRRIYGDSVPDPTATLITRWASDPFANGSYSFMALGATGQDYEALAKPVGDRLFFAGEATNRKYPATVHGAFLSGIREARRIINL